MRYFRLLSCIAATFAASALFADAGNTLVTFSTVGDFYADGTPVKDGEWYALCWSPNASFGGISNECEPVVAGDKIFLMAPLAENGCCPTVVFQIDSKVAPTDGNYFVYLFDTRGVDGKPSKSVDGKPAIVSAAVATTAKAKGGDGTSASTTVTNAKLSETAGGGVAWGESKIDESKIGQPDIKSFRVEGDKVVIKVSNMHSSVLYNVFSGATPDTVTSTTLSLPISAEKNNVEFYLDKDQGKFFKVGRQPIAK